jgi:2-keto-3-deoxy-L-rhamnonate aldolase RhmA
MKRVNRLRNILAAGKIAVGTCADSYSPAAIEVIGYSGLDWVRVDNEYSWRRDESMEHMMRAAAVVDLTAMIRVEKGDPYLISKAFQCGAEPSWYLISPAMKKRWRWSRQPNSHPRAIGGTAAIALQAIGLQTAGRNGSNGAIGT